MPCRNDPRTRPSGSPPHESAALHVTGKALYTDDLVERTKDVLHAYPVQVPHAHGRVTGLRTDPALAVPGVVRVLTAADVPGVNDAGVKHDEPLFPSEVMFYGHAVCWVLGETLEAARLGAAAVEVDVEPLPSYIKVTEAIEADSFQGAMPQVRRGDIEAGLAAATHVFSGELEFSGQEHFYLETHCALAHVDEGEQVFVQSSTQHRPRRRRSWPTCWAGTTTRSRCSACAWAAASAARRCSRTALRRSPRWARRSPDVRSGCG